MPTPNMNLTIPTVGVTAGPAYATQVNAALTVIDAHNHSSGSGVQITPSGLNINSDLSFASNDAVDLRTTRFTAQPSALPGSSPDLGCLYVVNDDLYYNDGAGNQIPITTAGGVAGSPGNITGLVAPASVTYTSGGSPNYKFLSTATISANLDAASYIMRNPGVTTTYGLTLQAPVLASNYSLTLPFPPAASSFVQIDSSGVVTNTIPVALGINTGNIADDAITTAKILNLNVTNAKIANATITANKLAFSVAQAPTVVNFASSTSTTVPAGVTSITATAWGGGGGGAGGGGTPGGGGGGGGGSGGSYASYTFPAIAGETLTITVGAGGALGAPSSDGSVGANSSVSAGTSGWSLVATGGAQGLAGSGTTGGSGGTTASGGGLSSSAGGTGGGGAGGVSAGFAGARSAIAAAVAGMPSSSGINGGGGSGGAGRLSAGTQIAGNDGTSAAANSAAGGGGGTGSQTTGQQGGNGGSGYVTLIYTATA